MTANAWKCEVDWSRVTSNRKGTDRYFAGTPPLALVRHVTNRAATLSKAGKKRQLLVLDAKRAFLHADALTETYVKPPHLRDTERCCLLKKCMYATLLAAGRQHLVQKVGTDIGLLSSRDCSCAFRHSTPREKLTRDKWLSLDSRQRDHRRAQALQSQVHHWTTRNWNPMGKKPITACQQDWHIWHRTDLTLQSLARISRAVGKATRADLSRLKRIGRCLLCMPRAVWEFPLQQEESIVQIDGLSNADAAGCPKTARSTSGEFLRVDQHTFGNLVDNTESGVTKQRGVRILQHRTLCKCGHRIGQHDTRAVRGVSWSFLATVPKRKSRRSLDMNLLWTAEKGVWKVWKKSNRKERNKEMGEENNHHTTHR